MKGLAPENICTDSRIDIDKLILGVLEPKEFYKRPTNEVVSAAAANYRVIAFLQQHDRKYFDIQGPRYGVHNTIDAYHFLSSPASYKTRCKVPAPSSQPLQEARADLDKAAKKAGELFQVRKDVDNLQKVLPDAAPASVSFFRDKLESNSRFSYEITVGR